MAFVLNKNVTIPSGGVSPVISITGLDFASNFRVERNTGRELRLQNITSPLGLGEDYRFAFSEIANIYNGTTVDRALQAPSKKGVSILNQVNETWSVTDEEKPEFIQYLPVSCHMVIRVPSSPYISAADVNWLIGRMMAGLFETGSTTNDRIAALLRGSLIPKDL